MKHYARVNEEGFLQVFSPLYEPEIRGVEVDAEVAKEPGFYELKGGRAVRKPPAAVDAILAARAEQERRKKKLDEFLSK